MEYVLTINDEAYQIKSDQDLENHLARVSELPFASLALYQKADKPPSRFEKLVYQSVGLVAPTDSQYLSVLTNKDANLAFVTFVDEEDKTFYSANPLYSATKDKKAVFVLATGEEDTYYEKECVPVVMALEAVRLFFQEGKQPSAISWSKPVE